MGAKYLVVYGTRPEAIKVYPLIKELERAEPGSVRVLSTGQQKDLLGKPTHQMTREPDFNLTVSRTNPGLNHLMADLLRQIDLELTKENPSYVIVQGDTTSALAAAICAFNLGIRVAHVEAGLRTFDLAKPFPEEGNRAIISKIANLHFAPTETARKNLVNEGVDSRFIFVSGNTGIDALFLQLAEPQVLQNEKLAQIIKAAGPLVTVTVHRRENLIHLNQIANALIRICQKHPDFTFVLPLHPNPALRPLAEVAERVNNLKVIEPLAHSDFIQTLKRSAAVISDSGGIQEEAPSLGIKTLVLRDSTERPEALDSGLLFIGGVTEHKIVESFERMLRSPSAAPTTVYGDGSAGVKIATVLRELAK